MGKTIHLAGFSGLVDAETVKEFVEGYTGRGTVYALEVREPKRQPSGSRSYAIVQFKNAASADCITLVPSRNLTFGTSALKVFQVKDLMKPMEYLHEMEGVVIHFGCLIAKEKFSTMWRMQDISVKFGLELKELYFFLSDCSVDYKLVLFRQNVRQIELHCPNDQKKFLVFQLYGAPRIYKKREKSVLRYYQEAPEDQWLRVTDFTQMKCIGQSYGICLEFSSDLPLNVLQFDRKHGSFYLQDGCSFCSNLGLVPIISPPGEIDLPYEILFRICLLIHRGCLAGPTLDIDFFKLVEPREHGPLCVQHALDKLVQLKECCYDLLTWLHEQYREYRAVNPRPSLTATMNLDDKGLVYIQKVRITPCKVYFSGPEVNMSNRVLRQYRDDISNFLRVSFVDEEMGKLFHKDLLPGIGSSSEERRTSIYGRVLATLKDGIIIGEKKFDFLAYSSSQLRDNSAWMFASREGLTADDLRRWLGDFSQIRNVGKYSARLGQSFSSSMETVSVGADEIEVIPDVVVETGGITYVFSDGIGKISSHFSQEVAKKCGLENSPPSAFQIRYGGYKGVVATDPTSSKKMSLRPSMSKYTSDNTSLDVLSWSKYLPFFLNRQLITLLSSLGVEDHIFEKKQREAIELIDTMLTDPLKALEFLKSVVPREISEVLKKMVECGYQPNEEPFLSMMLRAIREGRLLEVQTRGKIFIQSGRNMMGCLDEYAILEYGEVFLQISDTEHRFCILGDVFVAKSPCLHPGDVRVLKAVEVSTLKHLMDCIVFPQKGSRPHPNECSGSDLDGDLYYVCWDPELIPPQQMEPTDYTPAQSTVLDHEVTIEEVIEFFTNFIGNDKVGLFSNAHTAFADGEPEQAKSNRCTRLARLCSLALDFPKSGVPIEIPNDLWVTEYPDFMEKPNKPVYISERVLGKLYRQSKAISRQSSLEVAQQFYDSRLEVDGFEVHLDDALRCKIAYNKRLGRLMDFYGIETEAEIISGNILTMSKPFHRKNDSEEVRLAVESLWREVRTWLKDGDEDEDGVDKKASAWYYVTYHESYSCHRGTNHENFISFPWCICDRLIQIMKVNEGSTSGLQENLDRKTALHDFI